MTFRVWCLYIYLVHAFPLTPCQQIFRAFCNQGGQYKLSFPRQINSFTVYNVIYKEKLLPTDGVQTVLQQWRLPEGVRGLYPLLLRAEVRLPGSQHLFILKTTNQHKKPAKSSFKKKLWITWLVRRTPIPGMPPLSPPRITYEQGFGSEFGSAWIRINLSCWIRIRIRIQIPGRNRIQEGKNDPQK